MAEGEIKEGFLCPVCHTDMRSPKNLIAHFEEAHSEEQDVLKSLKELFGKAKNKILKIDDRDFESLRAEISLKYYLEEGVPQDPGQTRSHLEEFRRCRRDRLDHRTSETNKLIIRLDRLLRAEGTDRKRVAQELVPWLDGATVTRCPSCAVQFNFARRQHHCRLCGCIMCNNCSSFLPYDDARCIIKPMYSEESEMLKHDSSESLRICLHCEKMLENRRQVQLSQSVRPLICKLYDKLKKVRSDIEPNVDLYWKMYESITSGADTYQLQDAQSLKTSIAKQAELLDLISKNVAAIPPSDDEHPDTKSIALQNTIRRATSTYIKDHLITLPPLPTPAELEKIKGSRAQYEQENIAAVSSNIRVKTVAVATGWSPSPANERHPKSDYEVDPLIEQINIVRNYIEQAKQAQRFEEVASLRRNLGDLKEMYRQQQRDKERVKNGG